MFNRNSLNWLKKGSASILDQVFYSGANFLFFILLARWLEPATFGILSISYAYFSIFYQLHNGLISEPINVLGPANHSDSEKRYLKDQVIIHFLFTFILAIGMILVSLISYRFSGSRSLLEMNFYLALSIPFLLLPWFARRAFYFLRKPSFAVLTSILYATFLLVFIYCLKEDLMINAVFIYLVMSISSVLSFIPLFIFLLRSWNKNNPNFINLIKENWKYGKWIVISGLFVSLSNQIQIFTLGSLKNFEGAAVLRSLQYYIQPMIVIISALSIWILPEFSLPKITENKNHLYKRIGKFSLIISLIALLYWVCLWVFRKPVENMLYAGKYFQYVHLIPVIGSIPLIIAFSSGASVMLRALQRPKDIFIVSVFWFIISTITAITLIPLFGTTGAVLSMVIGQIIASITMLIQGKKALNRPGLI